MYIPFLPLYLNRRSRKMSSNNEFSEISKTYFAFNRWILKIAGLWTPSNISGIKMALYKIYAIFIFSFVNVFFTITEFVSLLETSENMETMIKNINFALTHLMGAIKCIFWFTRGNRLIEIMKTLQDERFQYEKSLPDFNPVEIMKESKKTGLKYTVAFFALAHLTLTSSYIPLFLNTLFNILKGKEALTTKQNLPYYSWIPFSYNTQKSYLLVLFYQFIPMYSYGYSIVGMDTLFMNIMNYIAGSLLLLKGAFKSIRTRCIKRLEHEILLSEIVVRKEMEKEMKKCVIHLQTIMSMSKELEDIHNLLTFGQIMATLFILCTSLFLVSTTPIASKQFASESVYLIAMGYQLVLYCWFGNQVTLRAMDIPEALWEGDWLGSQHSFRKSMMITMIRMRKPIYFTVGKFAPLTLTTFVAILKGSYSFFALLKKVNND